jgi:hypothetical protein
MPTVAPSRCRLKPLNLPRQFPLVAKVGPRQRRPGQGVAGPWAEEAAHGTRGGRSMGEPFGHASFCGAVALRGRRRVFTFARLNSNPSPRSAASPHSVRAQALSLGTRGEPPRRGKAAATGLGEPRRRWVRGGKNGSRESCRGRRSRRSARRWGWRCRDCRATPSGCPGQAKRPPYNDLQRSGSLLRQPLYRRFGFHPRNLELEIK